MSRVVTFIYIASGNYTSDIHNEHFRPQTQVVKEAYAEYGYTCSFNLIAYILNSLAKFIRLHMTHILADHTRQNRKKTNTKTDLFSDDLIRPAVAVLEFYIRFVVHPRKQD